MSDKINWPEVEMLVRVFFAGKNRMHDAEHEQPGLRWNRHDPPIAMMGDSLMKLAKAAGHMDGINAGILMHVGGGFLTATLREQDEAWTQVKLIEGRCEDAIGADPVRPALMLIQQQQGVLRMVSDGLHVDDADPEIYSGRATVDEQTRALEASAMQYLRAAYKAMLVIMRSELVRPRLIRPESPVAKVLDEHEDNSLETFAAVARAMQAQIPDDPASDVPALLHATLGIMQVTGKALVYCVVERADVAEKATTDGQRLSFPRAFYKAQDITDDMLDNAVRRDAVEKIGHKKPFAFAFEDCKREWPWLKLPEE